MDAENVLRRECGLMLSSVCVDGSEQPQWEGRLDSIIQESLAAAAVGFKNHPWTAKTPTRVYINGTRRSTDPTGCEILRHIFHSPRVSIAHCTECFNALYSGRDAKCIFDMK